MTLSRKKSRKIVVGNENFRWVISPDGGYIVFVAEHYEFNGRKIQVYINSDIDQFWVDFPNCEGMDLKIIKPKDAESIISQAITYGWNPKEKGTSIVFDLIDNLLIKRAL